MTNAIAIVAIIIVAIVILGYFSFVYFKIGQVDPKQMLRDYGKKFENTKSIKLNYDFKMPVLSYISMPEISMEYYKLNDDMKVVGSLMGTTTANYLKDGRSITCTESGLSTFTTSSSLSCSVKNSFQASIDPKVNETLYNETPVTYNGTKKIAGRTCDDFIIVLNESQIKNMKSPLTGLAIEPTNISSSTENKSFISYEVCMDVEYGYMALLNISFNTYSKLSGKSSETKLMSMEVTQASTDVKESDLEIPVAFALGDVSCSKDSIKFNITSLRDLTKPTVNVLLSSSLQNMSLSMDMNDFKTGETYAVNIPLTKEVSGYFTTNVCIGNDCQNDYCYIYSYAYTNPYSNSCYSHNECWYTSYSTGCCLGQCNITSHKCYSYPQSADFTDYGQKYFCTGNQTCGTDCKCH